MTMARARHHRKLIHEGDYAAEVDVELIDSSEGWGPYISLADAEKLDDVRVALRSGDLGRASELARVYRLMLISE
jgi:hypothetical protein